MSKLMSKTGSLTKNPTLLTAVLSLAALAGYGAYRLTLPGADPAAAAADAAHARMHDAAPVEGGLPDIVLSDLAGAPTPLSSYAGQPLLINFWATWCAPCRREIPLLKTFHDENESAITVVGIAIDDLEDVQTYAGEMAFNYPILVGQAEGMNAAAALGVEVIALPFSVYTAPDGTILGIHTGELLPEHLDTLAATIAELTAGAIDQSAARDRLADAL
jgi:thiol-disulfide isomerase/thioredoxin